LLANQIPPGSAHRIEELAGELSVSTTPVREALARLAVDGLVVKQPYRGWTASGLLDSGTIAVLYDARQMIEPELAWRAAARASDADRDKLQQLLAEPDLTGLDPSAQIDAWIAADEQLHGAIAALAGNAVILEFLERVSVRMRTHRAFYGRADAARDAYTEHEDIVAAIAAGDSHRAGDAMAQHLAKAADRMVHAFG